MAVETDLRAWRQRLRSIAMHPQAREPQPVTASRLRCANPGCRRAWFGFLKDHRRPIFEDRWACGARCLRALVDTAIRRESPTTLAPASSSEHAHRVPLGLILLSRGWITQSQLQHALAIQRSANGGRLGRWLIEECGVPEKSILDALALQWNCTVFSLHSFDPQPMALAVPREVIERTALVPLRVSHRGLLRLAFADRPNPAAAFALQRISGIEVESGLLSHADWKSACQSVLRHEPVRCSLEHLPDRETLSRRIASDLAGMAPRASRLVRIHNLFWLRMWLEDAARSSSHLRTVPAPREDVLDRIYTLDTPQTN
jgi:hypothetical protein